MWEMKIFQIQLTYIQFLGFTEWNFLLFWVFFSEFSLERSYTPATAPMLLKFNSDVQYMFTDVRVDSHRNSIALLNLIANLCNAGSLEVKHICSLPQGFLALTAYVDGEGGGVVGKNKIIPLNISRKNSENSNSFVVFVTVKLCIASLHVLGCERIATTATGAPTRTTPSVFLYIEKKNKVLNWFQFTMCKCQIRSGKREGKKLCRCFFYAKNEVNIIHIKCLHEYLIYPILLLLPLRNFHICFWRPSFHSFSFSCSAGGPVPILLFGRSHITYSNSHFLLEILENLSVAAPASMLPDAKLTRILGHKRNVWYGESEWVI